MNGFVRAGRVLLAGTLCLWLAGCFERKQTGMLNGDGSGKVTLETWVAVPPGTPADAVAEDGKGIVEEILSHSRGVDAWKGLAYDVAKDGRIHVIGTAYFANIDHLTLEYELPFTWTTNAAGDHIFAMQATGSTTQPATRPALSEAAVQQQVTAGKASYEAEKPMLQTLLTPLHVEASFTLPGKVTQTNILTSEGNTISLTVNGKELLAAMDKVMGDDQALADAIKNGRSATDNQELFIETLFHKKGPLSARVQGPVKQLFDYGAEVAEAKREEAGMYKKLGIDPTKLPGPYPGTVAPAAP